jgi:competence protein ComEC
MTLERPELFQGRTFLYFLFLSLFTASVSIFLEYLDYRELVRFDDTVAEATVLAQEWRTKEGEQYQLLKLRLDGGATLYATAPPVIRELEGYRVSLWMKTDRIAFVDYLKGFYAPSRIERVYPQRAARYRMGEAIALQHESRMMQQLYGALFAALPMERELREKLAALGISHLLAISGFHLGVLSLALLLLWKYPYMMLQERFFPYRSRKRDLFVIVLVFLSAYLLFLGMVPSLMRAFAMLLIGYLLYDRGLKILSFQSLAITVLILLALWPRLFFSIGFWLSVCGVFYIFLFLHHFSHWRKPFQFVGLHFWVYVMMLPIALGIFGQFSIFHPLSVLDTMLFSLFYPVTMLMHLFGFGALLDGWLIGLLQMPHTGETVPLDPGFLAVFLILSLAAVRYRGALWLLFAFALAVFVNAVYQVA